MHLHVFKTFFEKYIAGEKAATAIEYTLIAAAISLAIVFVVFGLGVSLTDIFTDFSNIMAQADIP